MTTTSSADKYRIALLRSLVKVDWQDPAKLAEFLTLCRSHLSAQIAKAIPDETQRVQELQWMEGALADVGDLASAPNYDPAAHLARLTGQPAPAPAPVAPPPPPAMQAQPATSERPPLVAERPASAPAEAPRARPPVADLVESRRGGKGMLVWALLAGLVGGGIAAVGYGLFAGGGCPSSNCYVSDWIAVDNTASRTISFEHGLGEVPKELNVWFSPNASGTPARALSWSWALNFTGNPVAIGADTTAVRIELLGGAPIAGSWNAANGQWTQHTRGFFRVVARR